MVTPDLLGSTCIHEAGHAVINWLLGETFQYVEIFNDREGYVMPYHSPCPLCDSEVPPNYACRTCVDHYEDNDPDDDIHSARIDRAFRIDGAIAAAGELAERRWSQGPLLASADELERDRERVSTRASLHHRWRADACDNHRRCRSARRDCIACESSEASLRTAISALLAQPDIWQGIEAVAKELKSLRRLEFDQVDVILQATGLTFGDAKIDDVWPRPPESTS